MTLRDIDIIHKLATDIFNKRYPNFDGPRWDYEQLFQECWDYAEELYENENGQSPEEKK